MGALDLEYDLLTFERWSDDVKSSPHYEALKGAAQLSLDLDTLLTADEETDAQLHRVFAALGAIVPGLPRVQADGLPAYTRYPWDLRALRTMIPAGLELRLEQDTADADGDSRWTAALFDPRTEHVAHPSELLHNAILCYSSSEYGEGWTPNIALARILLASFLLVGLLQVCPQLRGKKAVAGIFA